MQRNLLSRLPIRLIVSVCCLLAFGCDADRPVDKKVPKARHPDPSQEVSTEVGVAGPVYYETRAQILDALPEDIRNQETVEAILAWHRQAFRPVVLDALEKSNSVLVKENLPNLMDYNQSHTPQEADIALKKADSAKLELLELARQIDVRLAEQKKRLFVQLGSREDLRPLLDGLPINYLAAHSRGVLLLEADLCTRLGQVLNLALASREGELTAGQKKELREAAIAYRAKSEELKAWKRMDPKKADRTTSPSAR